MKPVSPQSRLLAFTDHGLYCPPGNFYIDPWRPVDQALITHAHADHARAGHGAYLAHPASASVLRARIGAEISLQTLPCGQSITLQDARVTFFPAGHIPGSVQIRIEHRGETAVAAGDYKTTPDGLSEAWEPVRCHLFVTESTFGLPIYHWRPEAEVFAEIHEWWRQNREAGKTSVLLAYSLGKAQRVLRGLDRGIGPVWVHESIQRMNDCLRADGTDAPDFPVFRKANRGNESGQMIVTPPAAADALTRRSTVSLAQVSGWMTVRGNRRRLALDRGFVLSDHADWDGLNHAVAATGAERVWVTHGQTEAFSRWLREEKGLDAVPVATRFQGEGDGDNGESEAGP